MYLHLHRGSHFARKKITATDSATVRRVFLFLSKDLNSPVFAHAIEDYRLLWVQMSKLIHDAGSYMSGTMTFCIFYTTIVVIYTIYILAVWGIIMIKLSFYKLLALTLAVLVCNGLSLYIYCDGGYSQTKKVGVLK